MSADRPPQMWMCSGCSQGAETWQATPCGHIFCQDCTDKTVSDTTSLSACCLRCRAPYERNSCRRVYLPTIGFDQITRLQQVTNNQQKQLLQAKKNQSFWAKKAIEAKQSASELRSKLTEQQELADSLDQSLRALRLEHDLATNQLVEVQKAREEHETTIGELMSSSQEYEKRVLKGGVLADTLTERVYQLTQQLNAATQENAALRGPAARDDPAWVSRLLRPLEEMLSLVRGASLPYPYQAQEQSYTADADEQSAAPHMVPRRQGSIESTEESSLSGAEDYASEASASVCERAEPRTERECLPRLFAIGSTSTGRGVEGGLSSRPTPVASNDPPERLEQVPTIPSPSRSPTPEFQPKTPLRKKRSGRTPATPRVILGGDGRPLSAKFDSENPHPKEPVATPITTPCTEKMEHRNWRCNGSNGVVRQYTCKKCQLQVKESHIGDEWVAVS